jgi:hypothetical protein
MSEYRAGDLSRADRDLPTPPGEHGPSAFPATSSDASSTTLSQAIETVGRAGSSSSVLAIETVHRLVRTMSAWIQTLQARRCQLADEIDARSRELEELERQIAQERVNAEAVARAARVWADEIEHHVLSRKTELQAETEALDAQLQTISASLKELPSATTIDERQGPMSAPAIESNAPRSARSSAGAGEGAKNE